MSTLTKYLLLQLPGWFFAVIVLSGVRHWLEIPFWIALGLFSLWVIKDLVMYPFLRKAYESGVKTGIEELIGARGIVEQELAPRGYIRVRGELWRAEAGADSQPIPHGKVVRVLAAEGMTLMVEAEE